MSHDEFIAWMNTPEGRAQLLVDGVTVIPPTIVGGGCSRIKPHNGFDCGNVHRPEWLLMWPTGRNIRTCVRCGRILQLRERINNG